MVDDGTERKVVGEVTDEKRVPVYVVFCHGVPGSEQEQILSDGAVVTRRFDTKSLNVELPVASVDRVENDSRVVTVERIK